MKWIDTSDPSWYKRVLTKLEEKYPIIAEQVWSEAVSDNAAEQEHRRNLAELNMPDAGNSGTH